MGIIPDDPDAVYFCEGGIYMQHAGPVYKYGHTCRVKMLVYMDNMVLGSALFRMKDGMCLIYTEQRSNVLMDSLNLEAYKRLQHNLKHEGSYLKIKRAGKAISHAEARKIMEDV